MSGGAYNYAYSRIEDFAYELERRANTPARKAFLRLLHKVSAAAKAIEWNDSGDGACDESELICAALGKDHHALCLEELKADAKSLIEQLKQYTEQ